MKNKEKYKYITIILALLGVLLLIISVVSADNTLEETQLPLEKKQSNIPLELSNKHALTPSVSTRLLDWTADDIDQMQDKLGEETSGNAIGPLWICQGIRNDRSPLRGFSIVVKEYYENTPTDKPMYFGIMKSKLTGGSLTDLSNWEIAYQLNPGYLPEKNKFYLLTTEFPNPINIDTGEKFYIVALSEDIDWADSNFFIMGMSGDNPGDVYSRGVQWSYNLDTSKWESNENQDTFFYTFTNAVDYERTFWLNAGEETVYEGHSFKLIYTTSDDYAHFTIDGGPRRIKEGSRIGPDLLEYKVTNVNHNPDSVAVFDTAGDDPDPDPDPEQPDIDITITTWTDTTVAAGFTSLFAACIAGSRFFGLF